MTTVLEVNDAELILARDGEILHRSPGIAVLLPDTTYFGDAALRLSRTHPRQTNAQYLTRLSGEALPFASRQVRNHADLVYLHLRELVPLLSDEVILAVPALLSADQLGILLGILQELEIRVSGFVDCAVAAAASHPAASAGAEHVCHVDVLMQRAMVTSLRVDEDVSRTGSHEVAECGLARLLESWVNVAADRFVQETRYDPLHAAASEQQLFDQLYDWIHGHNQSPERALEITQGDQTRRVELNLSLLEQKAAQRLRQLLDAVPASSPVLLSARAARLPGLRRLMENERRLLAVLPDDAPARGCLENLDRIVGDDGELRLVTRLPLATDSAAIPSTPAAAPAPAAPLPTHALLHGLALRLGAEQLALPVRVDGGDALLLADDGITLNGRPLIQDTVLATGDRVGWGADEYLIIHVEP